MNDVMYHGDKYKKIDVVGEKILIKKLKNWNDLVVYDGIIIPNTTEHDRTKNNLMGCGVVLDVTPETSEKYGISKDDIVVYDYWSAFGDSKDTIITNAENLILKVTEEESKIFVGTKKV